MLRAAQENKRLTSEKRIEQERLSDLARQADEKADAQLAVVVADLRDANAQYGAAVEEIITPQGDGGSSGAERANVFNSEFYNQTLANQESRMNGAYDEATR